ncbi:unnamed protein product [Rhodiola kirilowii]
MFPRRPAALKAHSTFVAYKNLIIHPPIFSSLPFPAQSTTFPAEKIRLWLFPHLGTGLNCAIC